MHLDEICAFIWSVRMRGRGRPPPRLNGSAKKRDPGSGTHTRKTRSDDIDRVKDFWFLVNAPEETRREDARKIFAMNCDFSCLKDIGFQLNEPVEFLPEPEPRIPCTFRLLEPGEQIVRVKTS
jgi:hypothetical protein